MKHYLKFTDEAQAIALMPQFRTPEFTIDGVTIPADWSTGDGTFDLKTIGVITKETGQMMEITDPNSAVMQVPVMVPIDAWHCNLRIDELPAELLPFKIEPKNARFVWAD